MSIMTSEQNSAQFQMPPPFQQWYPGSGQSQPPISQQNQHISQLQQPIMGQVGQQLGQQQMAQQPLGPQPLSHQIPQQYPQQPLLVQTQPHLQSLGQPLHSISIPPLHLSILKMSNVPTDLTPREARAIFALVLDELARVEIKEYLVYAYFKSVNTCVATAKLLDNKYIFGQDYQPVKVEYDHALPGLNAFNGLRISPDEEEKRVQRSRFVFSDPFQEPSIDLSDLSGKSLKEEVYDKGAKGFEGKPFEGKGFEGKGFEGKGFEGKGFGEAKNNFETFDKNSFDGKNAFEPSRDASNRESRDSQTSFKRDSTNFDANFDPNRDSLNFEIPPFESRDYDSWTGANSPGVDWASASAPSSGAPDRRRTSSAFFNNPLGSSAAPAAPSAAANAPTTAQHLAQGPPTAAALQTAKPQPKPASGTTTPNASKKENVADLSLLARVPPPANPADQNPPCNTLYVGNLPPDATEAELRALFSPQKGFRRLSFRTKNQTQSTGANGSTTTHNHGPMCFVEFEDVAHATRALAELYGRALPRPNGSNGKGGIRLSFSKNPLGVRGPGNPRRTSTNQVPGILVGAVGNYGYSSYKQ